MDLACPTTAKRVYLRYIYEKDRKVAEMIFIITLFQYQSTRANFCVHRSSGGQKAQNLLIFQKASHPPPRHEELLQQLLPVYIVPKTF